MRFQNWTQILGMERQGSDSVCRLHTEFSKLIIFAVIANLQDPQTGTFAGDEWGETDTRFLYGAFLALSLLHLLDLIDVKKAVDHVQACSNFDGGYGIEPGAESHSGQIFTCVGALSIANRLDLVDRDKVGAWLSERQVGDGGLNGRPEKLEDVCYSWWVGSSLKMIGRLHWIDGPKLEKYILQCQVCLSISVCDSFLISDRTQNWEAWRIDLVTWLTCSILILELQVLVY